MTSQSRAPYLQRVAILEERVQDFGAWPFSMPFVRDLSLAFTKPVTFFVGENGSGKSTLIEAIADVCGLPVSGGGKNELVDLRGPERSSPLAPALRSAFTARPGDAYFFRAEFYAHFASLLDQRRADPDFWENPYKRYGGQSLHKRSHGEAFLALLVHRMESGLFIMDEPESALSPQRQLTLLARLAQLVGRGSTQVIIATHSPILLTFPDADIISFDEGTLASVRLEDTSHYQITKGILDAPKRYWSELMRSTT
jgi:predicted ATPase